MRTVILFLTGISEVACLQPLKDALLSLSPDIQLEANLPHNATVTLPDEISDHALRIALAILAPPKSAVIVQDDAAWTSPRSSPHGAVNSAADTVVDIEAVESASFPPDARLAEDASTQVTHPFQCGCDVPTCTCSPVRILSDDPRALGSTTGIAPIVKSSSSSTTSSSVSKCCCSLNSTCNTLLCPCVALPSKTSDPHHGVTLSVSGMTYATCVTPVQTTLLSTPGVSSCTVSLLTASAQIHVNPTSFRLDEALKLLENAGYQGAFVDEQRPNLGKRGTDKPLHLRFSSLQCAQEAHHILQSSPTVSCTKILCEEDLSLNNGATFSIGDVRRACACFCCLSETGDRADEKQLPIVRLTSSSKLEDFVNLQVNGISPEVIPSTDALLNGGLDPSSLLLRDVRNARTAFFGALLFTLPLALTMLFAKLQNPFGAALSSRIANSAFTVFDIVALILATPVQFVFGFRFYRGAWYAIRNKHTNMDVLIALGTTVAYFFGIVVSIMETVVLRKGGEPSEKKITFDTSAMVISIVLLGKWLEAIAKRRTTMGIEALSKLAPRQVDLVRVKSKLGKLSSLDTVALRCVDVALVSVGDCFRIKAGAAFPLDGRVVEGETVVDESTLTGESSPVRKVIGDDVFAGSINGRGSVVVECVASEGESMLDRIIQLVRRAQMNRAPVEGFADRVMSFLVPSVLSIAILSILVWFGLARGGVLPVDWMKGEGDVMFSLLFGLSVLFIACPCALGLATQTVVMVATSVAARKAGILYKEGGQALQAAHAVTHVLFDKTGTLTVGRPTVTTSAPLCIAANGNIDLTTAHDVGDKSYDEVEKRVLRATAAAEYLSDHPLARAIVTFAKENDADCGLKVRQHESHIGRGVCAIVDDECQVTVGRPDWVCSHIGVIDMTTRCKSLVSQWEDSGRTVVLASVSGIGMALFGVEDAVREDSARVVRRLKELGITCGMVTGDSWATAKCVANTIGIAEDEVTARALPEDKARVVERAIERSRVKNMRLRRGRGGVAFVANGVNDSAALSSATVGIAVGTGRAVAAENAGVSLVDDNIWNVVTTVDLARCAMRRVRLNLFWALGFNTVGIMVAAGVLYPPLCLRIPPFAAAAAMAASSVAVVMCSLTLARYKRPIGRSDDTAS